MDGAGATRRGFVVGLAALTACAAPEGALAPKRPGGRDRRVIVEGFGGVVDAGPVDEVLQRIDDGDGFLYLPEMRGYLVRYPAESLEAAREVYDGRTLVGLEAGLLALYQKCPHLGCRVPECRSSGRFECGCHASVFTGVGELVGGPAPRGMDRFPISIEDGRVLVDTALVIEGAPDGTSTTDGEPSGPACLQ